MAGTIQKPTLEEALQYDHDSLMADTKKRENNIKIFEDAIEKELQAMDQNKYMISQIDPTHDDVKKLKEVIKKMNDNISTFDEAIQQEKQLIKRDLEMIELIESN